MSMLSDALDSLADDLATHYSVSATYTRSTSSATLAVIPGRPDDQRKEPGRSRVKLDARVVMLAFKPADLDFGAGAVEPARGDRITVDGYVREVSPGDGQPFMRRIDLGNLIQVRTILVTEP